MRAIRVRTIGIVRVSYVPVKKGGTARYIKNSTKSYPVIKRTFDDRNLLRKMGGFLPLNGFVVVSMMESHSIPAVREEQRNCTDHNSEDHQNWNHCEYIPGGSIYVYRPLCMNL